MVILKADNRGIVRSEPYSFLSTNYQAGTSALVVVNAGQFSDNDFILFGNFGSETAEIIRVSSVDHTTQTLTLISPTQFPHPESTKVTTLPYDQVGFYHTVLPTFSNTEDILSEYTNIMADRFFTTFTDNTNETGFGWFRFRNSWTSRVTGPSNAIPYGDFAVNSVSFVMDSFYSLLNEGDLKLISNDDAYAWLNEAYDVVVNELNLVEEEYLTAPDFIITTTTGVVEYDLPDDFSNVVSIYVQDPAPTQFYSRQIENISLDKVGWYLNAGTMTDIKYYLRNNKIGFVPVASGSSSYIMKYNKRAVRLTSLYDTIDLPDNNFYMLKDFMMFRATQKLGRPNPLHLDLFKQGLDRMKMVSIKRSDHPDTFLPVPTSNI